MIYALAILVLLFASVFFMPVGVELDYSERGRKWYVWWMGLSVPVSAAVEQVVQRLISRRNEKPRRETQVEKEESEPPSFFDTFTSTIEGMQQGAKVFWPGIKTLRRMKRHVHVRVRRMEVVIASPNPALTGFSYGMMWAFAGAVPWNWPVQAGVDFAQTSPKVNFRIRLSAVPVSLLWPAGLFIWKSWIKKSN